MTFQGDSWSLKPILETLRPILEIPLTDSRIPETDFRDPETETGDLEMKKIVRRIHGKLQRGSHMILRRLVAPTRGAAGFGGASGRGEARLSADSGEWCENSITPCSPCSRAASPLGYSLSRRPLTISHCFKTCDS